MYALKQGDCLELLRSMDSGCVDLVFTSPPYEDARTYGIDFSLKGQEYVDWCVDRYLECYRVCRGLVAWVIEGKTRNYEYSATPMLLAADLKRRGVKLRKPPAFHRVGIPGSGGPDWLRNDYEFIVCASHGKLPWSDNTACGHAPKWAPGGAMSNRTADGRRKNARDKEATRQARVNQWGHSINSGATVVDAGGVVRSRGKRPSHAIAGSRDGAGYDLPVKANPGNVIKCIVGGGVMGHKLSHENEAPFPLTLAEFFVKSFCPPGGTVLDPFSGSGTTGHAAVLHGRNYVGFDLRESQIELTQRRLESLELIAK